MKEEHKHKKRKVLKRNCKTLIKNTRRYVFCLKIQVKLHIEDALKQKTFLNLFMVELMDHGIILRVMHLEN